MQVVESSLVFGLGINDADYVVSKYRRENGKNINTWTCPYYKRWHGMLMRCVPGGVTQRKYPTYIGCSVADEWKSFMEFKSWMASQDWHGKELDKDLLVPGNKVYGPDYCVFLSRKLNGFMQGDRKGRNGCPVGVSKRRDMFIAVIRNPFTGKMDYLGTFVDASLAHEAWRVKKNEIAMIYADMQSDVRIAEALRTRYLP